MQQAHNKARECVIKKCLLWRRQRNHGGEAGQGKFIIILKKRQDRQTDKISNSYQVSFPWKNREELLACTDVNEAMKRWK